MDILARFIAIEEIRQLKSRYFRLLDMRDFTAMAGVFSADAIFDCSEGLGVRHLNGRYIGSPGPIKRGRVEIMEWIEQAFADRTCVHHGHGHEITLLSDVEARGVIAMQDQIFEADRSTRIVQGCGHYHESYQYNDGAWRISATRLTRLSRSQAS